MSKIMLKRIIMAVGSFFTLIMMFVVNVNATNTLILGDSTTIRGAGKSSLFTFIGDASKNGMFSLARFFMITGFIMVFVSAFYFITILILEYMNKQEIIKKLSLISGILQFVIVGAVIFILLAGIDKEQIVIQGVGSETLDITLFDFSFIVMLLFSLLPVCSNCFLKNK